MNKLTLLCVEDDIEALEDITYLLKRYFYKVYTATNGEMALNSYNDYHPDIILLDINIPKLNGLEVASKIRESNKNTPIIFLTAHSDKDKLLKAINLKVSSYIIKPFKIQELKEIIFKVIKEIDIENCKIQLADGFIWDKDSYELFYENNQIALTKNEILLIKLLLTNRSKFLTVNEILLEICTNNNDSIGNNIVQLISRFKKKIQKQLQNDKFFIENTYGSGYKIK
ncbi:MAG: response regulator transcription factor [Arcobacteraceae bacterium]|nr:response regulator transcription factor [Arcobacteraceae bacterium]